MWKFIEKLRSFPEATRKAVVLFSSAFITFVLLISWLVFPVPHFGSLSDAEKERKSAEGLITPFSLVSGEVHGAVGGIQEQWASLGGTTGILSVISALKENMAKVNATSSIATTTPEENALSLQEAFLSDSNIRVGASTTNETIPTAAAEKKIAATTTTTGGASY